MAQFFRMKLTFLILISFVFFSLSCNDKSPAETASKHEFTDEEKQKITMLRIQRLGHSIEEAILDTGNADFIKPDMPAMELATWLIDNGYAEMSGSLKDDPEFDGHDAWGFPILVDKLEGIGYRLTFYCQDAWPGPSVTVPGTCTFPQHDIIWTAGRFSQAPKSK